MRHDPGGRGRWRLPAGVGLLALLVAGAGWTAVEVARGSTPETSATTSAQTAGPVSEYALAERGEPVQLSGTSLTDTTLDVADYRGRVVVLNVWGSWCVPCREEAPTLARLSKEYAAQGVQFLGIDIKDNRASALAFQTRYGIGYPSIEDTDGRALLSLTNYVPAQAVPVTLVLDAEGRVASRVVGVVREATLRALLDSTLAEKAPA